MSADEWLSESKRKIPHNSTVPQKQHAFCMYNWVLNKLLKKCKTFKTQLTVMKVSQDLMVMQLLLRFTIFLFDRALFVSRK